MAAEKFHVHSVKDKPKVLAFFRRIAPQGASIHYDGNTQVWLLKPTDRGGVTIGRVLLHVNSAQIDEMMGRAWAEYNGVPFGGD